MAAEDAAVAVGPAPPRAEGGDERQGPEEGQGDEALAGYDRIFASCHPPIVAFVMYNSCMYQKDYDQMRAAAGVVADV